MKRIIQWFVGHWPPNLFDAALVLTLLAALASCTALASTSTGRTAIPLRVTAGYAVYTDYEDVVVILPQYTTDAQDIAAVQDIASQVTKQGRDARVTVCVQDSRFFSDANECVGIYYFAAERQ